MATARRALSALATTAALTVTALGVAPPASAATTVTDFAGLAAAFTAGTADIVLGADITAPGNSIIDTTGTVGLDLNGHDLTITSPSPDRAGIHVPAGTSLTIDDTPGGGTLTVQNDDAAGIGGDYADASDGSGTITINGGTITASSNFGAAIGAGGYGHNGSITVNGGTITASSDTGAGIGGGNGGDGGSITINGGTVTADSIGGAALGGGIGGSGGAVSVGALASVTLTGNSAIGAGPGGFAPRVVFTNAGTITITSGSALTVRAPGQTASSSGTIVNDGTVTGGGTIANTGRIVGSGTLNVAVTDNNYLLRFDTGGIGTTPANLRVYAPRVDAAQASLPTLAPGTGRTFAGWHTDTTYATQIGDTTDLATPFGAGPRTVTLHARVVRSSTTTVTTTPPTPAPGDPVHATATIAVTDDLAPSGQVRFSVDGTQVATVAVTGATVTSPALTGPGGAALTAGAHQVQATYVTDSLSQAGSLASTTLSVSTPSTGATVTNPTITAHLDRKPDHQGWYRRPVTVTFTCSAGSAALTATCPAAVTLRHNGSGQTVSRTVTATDGGTAAATITGIRIDRSAPRVAITRVHGRMRCAATDRLSGIAHCTVRTQRTPTATGYRVRYTANATDQAGNRRIKTRTRTVRIHTLQGATLRDGRFQVHPGGTYTLVVTGQRNQPTYYAPTPAPGTPMRGAGHGTWTLTIHLDPAMAAGNWTITIKTGHRIRTIPLHVG